MKFLSILLIFLAFQLNAQVHQIEFSQTQTTIVDAKGTISLNTFDKSGNATINLNEGYVVLVEYPMHENQKIFRDTFEIATSNVMENGTVSVYTSDGKSFVIHNNHLIYSRSVGACFVTEKLF